MAQEERPLCDNIAVGIWKFGGNVTFGALIDLAREWRESGGDNSNFLDLHVRKCDTRKFGIGFKYKHRGAGDYEQFFNRMTDELKRRFGNDFVGYDVASMSYLVK
jgi:hypothetical protein